MTFLLTFGAASALHAQSMHPPDDPAQAFSPAWAQLADTAGWQMIVSAPFPQTWPPPAGARLGLVRYAFAVRLRPGLADGVEVASPWALSVARPDGTVTVTVLQRTLDPLGIQGVRPLRTGELAVAGHEAEAKTAALLEAGGNEAMDDSVRATTCNWIDRNGVVAAAITAVHSRFTGWLACPSRAAGP